MTTIDYLYKAAVEETEERNIEEMKVVVNESKTEGRREETGKI